MQRIALLGVGTMGAGMAANWLKKGFPRRSASASTMSWARGLLRSRLWTSRLGEREFRTRGVLIDQRSVDEISQAANRLCGDF